MTAIPMPQPVFAHGVKTHDAALTELKDLATFLIDKNGNVSPMVVIHQKFVDDPDDGGSMAILSMDGYGKDRIQSFIKNLRNEAISIFFMDEAWQVERSLDSKEMFTDMEVSKQPDKEEIVFIMDYADHAMLRAPLYRDKDDKPCLGEWEKTKHKRIEGRFGPDEPKEDDDGKII